MAKFPLSFLFILLVNVSLAQLNPSLQKDLSVEMSPDKSIVENTEESDNHRTLSAAVKAADLEDVLDESGPFTVFAPSDLAFNKMAKDKMNSLLRPENKRELHSVITYHIVAGNLSASKILKAMCRGNGKATFTTVQGNKLTATMRGIDIILTDDFGNTATITKADANQCNGVIHVIDSVVLPKRI